MEPRELIEALAEALKPRGINCLIGVFVTIADKAGMPIKSMRLTFHETAMCPVTTAEFKFPRLTENKT